MLHSITSAKKTFFTIKPSHSAIMLAFCALSASIAQATCTPLNSATVTCTNGPDTGSQVTSFTGNSTITATGWSRNGGYFQARDPGADGTVTFNGDGVTITSGGGGTYGAIHLSASGTGATGGNTSLTIKNSSISSTFATGHGLASHANNATGSAELTLINTNVNMAASTTSGYGLVVTANGSGNATLRVTGGSITTANSAGTGSIDHSYAISAHSGSGNVDAKLSGGTITSTGTGAIGINAAVDSGAGTVLVENGNTISTGGAGAHGISTSSVNGDSNVINYGAITTGNSNAHGIYSRTTGVGTASITNSNNITINGSSTALRIEATKGNVTINQNGGDITINGAVGNGAIYAMTNGAGSATVNMDGGTLTNNSTDASGHGLEAKANGTGDATVKMTAGSVSTKGGLGIAAWTGTIGTGNAKVTTEAGTTIDASGTGNPGGIYARGGNTVSVDSKSVIRAGTIGIQASSINGGNVSITQTGGSITSGAAGINAKSTGDISVINLSNQITTQNASAKGIHIENTGGGNINIQSTSSINAQGNIFAGGIFVNSTNSHISSDLSGNISTIGTFSPAIELISKRTNEGINSSQLNYHDGIATVGAGSNAISLWAGGAATGAGTINIGSNVVVNASRGLSAVQNMLPDEGQINIAAGTSIVGGSAAGVDLASARSELNNSGDISALSDLAVHNFVYINPLQSLSIANQNSALLTGFLTLGNGTNNLNNMGIWNLRNFADTDGDQIRETLSVASSNFGTSGNNQMTNSGTLNLLGDAGSATTLNNAGEYSTGYTANTMSLAGPAQGQILGLQSFTNSGTIDLSSNNTVGDVLLISGSTTAGTAGNGVYIADGGHLKIDTVLNEGGTNSQSDMLVVDGTRLGSSATRVQLNNIGGSGAMTVDNGIEVIRVLDSARSETGVFKLGARATAGLYEYDLYKGGVDTSVADGNWYLRTLALPVNPDNPNTPVTPAINPESTVYLRNLNAASTMFMHTLHDRLGEPQFTDAYNTGNNNPSSAWVRVVSNHTDSTGGNGQIDLNTDTNLVHLGADIARWSNNGTDRWNIGVMGAYGQSKIDASPNVLGVTPSGFKRNATGKVDGYSVGGYATWYQNKDKPEGIYVDTWAQYGWYDNKVQGNTKAEESYNSNGWTASVEAGYAMIARDEGKNRQLMFEPQIQVAYNNFSSDDHTDGSGTRITDNNANGVITRVGARLYSRSTLNDNGIQPFVEANWWYSDAKNSLAFNGETMSDGTPNSRYELKAGLQGEVAKNWLMWGHAGVQFGSNDFNRYEGMVGIKRMF